MAVIEGLYSARRLRPVRANSIVGAEVLGGTLVLRRYDGSMISVDASGGGEGGGFSQEEIEDIVALLIDDNSDLDWNYNDATASMVATIKPGAVSSSEILDFTEAVQDALNATLAAGTQVSLSYDDNAGTLTVNSAGGGSLDAEAVRDAIGIALLGVGNISVAVNDAGDTITISTTATANDTDANLKNRDNHTGTQAISTVNGLQAALDAKAAQAAVDANVTAIGLKADAVGPFAPTMTGAAAGGRFVGATAGGAPATGNFLVGDFVIDRGGSIWVCTVAGGPGTWVDVTKTELSAKDDLTNVTYVNPTESGFKVIPGLTDTVWVPNRPIHVFVEIYAKHTATNGVISVAAYLDGAQQHLRGLRQHVNGNTDVSQSTILRIPAPAAGVHTIDVRFSTGTAGTAQLTGTVQPSRMIVTRG